MNVNCPGCNFSYKLDERRIPPNGQKMRCSKCSTSFTVTPKGVEAKTTATESVAKKTMIGLGGASRQEHATDWNDKDSWETPLQEDAPFQNTEAASTGGNSGISDTHTFGSFSGIDSSPADAFQLDDPDLPTPLDSPDTEDADLPTPASDNPFGGADLPTPAIDDPFGDTDLPTPASDDFENIDLPTPADDPFGDADLPTPTDDAFGDADLPTPTDDPFGDADLPSPADDAFKDADLPSPADDAFKDADLPSPADDAFKDADLPSPADDLLFNDMGTPTEDAAEPALSEHDDPFSDAIPAPVDFDSIDASSDDPFSLPSPARNSNNQDTLMGNDAAEAPSDEQDVFGNIDISEDAGAKAPLPSSNDFRKSGTGTTDFGQINLGTSSEESDEFDAFPVHEEEEEETLPTSQKTNDDNLDIVGADASLSSDIDHNPFLSQEDSSSANQATTASDQRKIAGSFEGRRKMERQQRRNKILLLVVLVLVAVSGAALHFTPWGAFGVTKLISLIPSATSDKAVSQHFASVVEKLNKDTVLALNTAIDETNTLQKELPQNEDLRLISVYLHNWHQVRFGISKTHESAALRVLKNMDPEDSESKYAHLANSTRAIISLDYKKAISIIEARPTKSSNDIAILATSHLRANAPDKAIKTIAQDTNKNKPRLKYLQIVGQTRLGNRKKAQAELELMTQSAPSHWDAKILLARLLVDQRTKETQKVTALLTPVHEAPENAVTSAQSALVHSILGTLLMHQRKFEQAKKEFEKAETLNPRDPLMLVGNGRLAMMAGDIPGAMTFFRNANNEAPSNIDAQLGLAEGFIIQEKTEDARNLVTKVMDRFETNDHANYLMGMLENSQGKQDSAIDFFKKAITQNPEHINAYVRLAGIYMDQEKTQMAMETLDKASSAAPYSATIKLTLADGHAANEDYQSAIITLNEALEIEPDNPIIHFKMAKMYRKMESFEDAQNALDEVTRLHPEYPGISIEQGYLMELSGKIDDALRSYESALEDNPDDIVAKTRVAAASIYQKKYDRAKELLVDVLNENPESSDGNFYMGEVFRLENSGSDAIPYLKSATELAPNNPLYHVRYGAALMQVHDFKKATEQYQKARELDPKMAETYIRTGELKLRSGSAKDSIADFQKALEMDPEKPGPRLLIGQAYEELADHVNAGKYYKLAVDAFPDNAEAHYRLGIMYRQTHGNKRAIAPLQRAVNLSKTDGIIPQWITDALYHLGMAQKATGNKKGAIETFAYYMEIAPENAIDRSVVSALLKELRY